MTAASESTDRRSKPTRGLRSIAAAVDRVARPMLRRRGMAAARILTDWAEIVGPDLAAYSLPERLVPGAHGHGGTLHVRVSGGLAIELQHLEPLVVERINSHFGYKAVAGLRLVQGPLPRANVSPPVARRPIPAAEDAALTARLEGIADTDLRDALAGLGRAMLSRGEPPTEE